MLRLSEADCERLAKKAGSVGLTVPSLLEHFIGDLVDGTYTNGSDERMHAEQWFDRCGFGMFEDRTLLGYLLDYDYDVDDFLTAYDEMKLYEENPEEYVKDLPKTDEPMWFYEEYDAYVGDFLKERGEQVDMEKEVGLCRKWLDDLNSLKYPPAK